MLSPLQLLSDNRQKREMRESERDFVSLARCLLLGNGSVSDAQLIANDMDAVSHRVRDILEKAAPGSVGGLGTSPLGWGGDLSGYELVAGAFSASLRNIGIFDALLAVANRVPLKRRVTLSTSAIVGDEVSEGDPKPVHELVVSASDMAVKKYSAIIVATEELLQLSHGLAEFLIATELRNAVVAAVDNAFVDGLVAATAPIGSTGAPLSDIGALLTGITSGANANFYAVTTPAIAKQFAMTAGTNNAGPAFDGFTATGGTIAGVKVLVSDHIAAGVMLGIDATGLALAASELSLSAADQASITLGDSPGVVTNLWQENLKALKVERLASWKVLRAASIASVNNINYGTSP